MTVLAGGLFLIEVETAPDVWAECADLTRVQKSNSVTISRTRVFRKTYRAASAADFVYTLNGLLNYADAGQQALIAAERTNTPIRVRWSEEDNHAKMKIATVRVATITHDATPDPGEIQTVSYEIRSPVAPIDFSAPPTTLEELLARINAVGPVRTLHAIEAGRGHTITAGHKGAIADAFGSSSLDLVPATGTGLTYDPAAGDLGPGGPDDGAGATPGTDSMVTGDSALLGNLFTVGSPRTVAMIYKAHKNPNSYEWGLQRTSDHSVIMRRQGAGGSNPLWTSSSNSLGLNQCQGRGLVPDNDGLYHLLMIDFVSFFGAIRPGQHHYYAHMIAERDQALLMGVIGAAPGNEATNRWSVGQAQATLDNPGSNKYKDALLVFDGQLTPIQKDVLWSWGQYRGAPAQSTKAYVPFVGNSFVSGSNVTTDGMFKNLNATLGSRADFVNLGGSGFTADDLNDRIDYIEKHLLQGTMRTKIVVPFYEFVNQITTDAATVAATLAATRAWCLRMRAILPAGSKILMTTPIAWNTDSAWLTNQAAVRTALLADTSGTYYDAIVDWGNPAWIWGQGATLMADSTRIQVGGGNHPTQLGYDELISDATHGMIPVLSTLIP
jgi:hypothetical protein